ncbi:MAG: hypothetical protein IPJ41_10825 [Phycisphaerales bacterium]|nr:hypothetical protein [Phycisphaerales bacterium]
MLKTLLRILAIPLLVAGAGAQTGPPVLDADSAAITIQDGEVLLQGVWTAGSIDGIEVYDAIRSARGRRVTFISDTDSVSFDVAPGNTYEFVIRLGDGRLCPTRVSTITQGLQRMGRRRPALPVRSQSRSSTANSTCAAGSTTRPIWT